ncbi:hypothetical protein JQ596_28280 [Bradyrhizobium manausense]|uniref:hypothetical protein n=1 Tax=Bradyrhizobium TaxID=374 RepID=UPI001BA6737F|nr:MULTISPECIES: hypothetical protein [Bradyrhizobium]MBR0829440.1 hypothetical protein [Bradyrhizobium manausense]UVO25817.1 hypothetical protein KUF59_24920 [Bradyrhizobium arachidis]
MHLKRFANAVVMLLVAAGLLLAPLAAPVLAAPASGATGHDMRAMSTDTQTMSGDMQADMPCCPDQPQSKDCGSCPFVALCLLSATLPAPSGAVSLIERHAQYRAFAAIDDLLLDGLGTKPPDHPPRTDV